MNHQAKLERLELRASPSYSVKSNSDVWTSRNVCINGSAWVLFTPSSSYQTKIKLSYNTTWNPIMICPPVLYPKLNQPNNPLRLDLLQLTATMAPIQQPNHLINLTPHSTSSANQNLVSTLTTSISALLRRVPFDWIGGFSFSPWSFNYDLRDLATTPEMAFARQIWPTSSPLPLIADLPHRATSPRIVVVTPVQSSLGQIHNTRSEPEVPRSSSLPYKEAFPFVIWEAFGPWWKERGVKQNERMRKMK